MSDITITVKRNMVDNLIMKHLFQKYGLWLKINSDWYSVKIIIEDE